MQSITPHGNPWTFSCTDQVRRVHPFLLTREPHRQLGDFWDLLTHSCHPLGMHMKFPCRRHLKNIPVIELSYGFRDRFKSLHHPPASAHTHTGTDTHNYLSGCCASISASLQHCSIVILHLCDSIIDYQCLEQENLYFLHFF